MIPLACLLLALVLLFAGLAFRHRRKEQRLAQRFRARLAQLEVEHRRRDL